MTFDYVGLSGRFRARRPHAFPVLVVNTRISLPTGWQEYLTNGAAKFRVFRNLDM